MFVGFSRTLKRMGGFRLGLGFRLSKRNAWFGIFALFFIAMAYLMWYMLLAAGWGAYFMLYGLYKCYYYMFKGTAWAVKKLYLFIKGKIQKEGAV